MTLSRMSRSVPMNAGAVHAVVQQINNARGGDNARDPRAPVRSSSARHGSAEHVSNPQLNRSRDNRNRSSNTRGSSGPRPISHVTFLKCCGWLMSTGFISLWSCVVFRLRVSNPTSSSDHLSRSLDFLLGGYRLDVLWCCELWIRIRLWTVDSFLVPT